MLTMPTTRMVPFILTAILGLLRSISGTECPPEWKSWRGSCYLFTSTTLNWTAAQQICDRPGSQLAVPESQEEHAFIWGAFVGSVGGDVSVGLWINCKYFSGEGKLLCAGQSETPNYKNWHDNFPSANSAKECVYMKRNAPNGEWANGNCDSDKLAVCEMKPTVWKRYCLVLGYNGRPFWCCTMANEIQTRPYESVAACGGACWAEPFCRSFSIRPGQAGATCRLSDAILPEAREDGSPTDGEQCLCFELGGTCEQLL